MAEKWEWVYRNFRLNYYVDVDSISRDNGKIIAKTSAIPVCETPLGRDDPKLFFSSETTAEFNCEDGSHQRINIIRKNKKQEIVFENKSSSNTFQKITNGGTAAWAEKICGRKYQSPIDDFKNANIMKFSDRCISIGFTQTENKSRFLSETYLDLNGLSIVNGNVLAWVRHAREQPGIEKDKNIYTMDQRVSINCKAKEWANLEIYKYDNMNKQIDSWKAPSNILLQYNSARPGHSINVVIEQACRNASKIDESDFNNNPNKPKNQNREPMISSTGSAFGVSKNQYITNAHVIEGCHSVKLDGVSAIVKATDLKSDLALLTAHNYNAAAKLRVGRLRQGESVTVVGYPLNGILASGAQVTTGNVSALAGMGNDSRFIQISAPVQPGNSGGPLVDSSGNVVGVVVSKLNAVKMANITGDIPQNVNFAISPLVLQAFLEANGVDYQTTPSIKNLSTADIADVAKKYTALVECYK
jgi:S1-C subfamily serine protease